MPHMGEFGARFKVADGYTDKGGAIDQYPLWDADEGHFGCLDKGQFKRNTDVDGAPFDVGYNGITQCPHDERAGVANGNG